jgi:phage shock protein A
MRQFNNGYSQDSALRRQAEAALRLSRQDIADMPVADVQQLIYELQVHQDEITHSASIYFVHRSWGHSEEEQVDR